MATVKVQQVKGYNHFKDEDIYYVCTKQTGTMSSDDLVENIVREGMIPRVYAEGVLKYLASAMFDYMKAGMAVQIPGLGTMKLNVKSKAQPTRQQATVSTITAARLQLLPNSSVKQELRNLKYKMVEEEEQ